MARRIHRTNVFTLNAKSTWPNANGLDLPVLTTKVHRIFSFFLHGCANTKDKRHILRSHIQNDQMPVYIRKCHILRSHIQIRPNGSVLSLRTWLHRHAFCSNYKKFLLLLKWFRAFQPQTVFQIKKWRELSYIVILTCQNRWKEQVFKIAHLTDENKTRFSSVQKC